MSIFVYVIDETDRIVGVSDNWLAFAEANEAAASCHPDRAINEPIWKFIDGLEATQFYEVIIANVRGRGITVTLPFRCDAPDRRRYLELTIAPVPQGYVEFTSRIIRTEPREKLELLQAGVPRSGELLTMCSVCRKVEVPGMGWAEAETAVVALRLFEEPVLPQTSHGLCPDCFSTAKAEIDRMGRDERVQ